MTKDTHAPGTSGESGAPWTPVPMDTDGEFIIREIRDDGGRQPIAFVYGPAFAERSEQGRKCLARARFFAAAPDLYRALDAIVRYAEAGEYQPGFSSLIPQAREALARAEGVLTAARLREEAEKAKARGAVGKKDRWT